MIVPAAAEVLTTVAGAEIPPTVAEVVVVTAVKLLISSIAIASRVAILLWRRIII